MKWQEGLAIGGAVLGDKTGATKIPLEQKNKKKQNDAIKEFAKGWASDPSQ